MVEARLDPLARAPESLRCRPSGVKAIAFYLPQYHPTPENDRWWGRGFTDWVNVQRARPLFPWQAQPLLPGELGFYDLRDPGVRQAQADLAREHGLWGFCYYHYWFQGRRLLHRPLDEVLRSGRPDFPFCLCWANENWTRIWDGGEDKILIRQTYSEEDDRSHIRWLIEAFRDPRYIRVEGKPLMLVYRAGDMPDPAKTAALWRREARRQGVGEIFLCRVESFWKERSDPARIGFDASVEFQPDWSRLGGRWRRGIAAALRTLGLSQAIFRSRSWVFPYARLMEEMLCRGAPPYRRFPCVTPRWDNTPRRRRGAVILSGSSPELYEEWLRRWVERLSQKNPSQGGVVFINAWNEWAEGNTLEPDHLFGRGYLEATRRALLGIR